MPALRRLLQMLDVASLPGLVGIAVAGLGARDARSLPLAFSFGLAALVLRILEDKAEFAGHRFLGAVVLGAVAFALADFFRPLPGAYRGVSITQLAAAGVAAAAFIVASVGARRNRSEAGDE